MQLISFLVGVVCASLVLNFAATTLSAEQIRSVGEVIVGFSATTMGFLITALSILVALLPTDLIQRLNRTGHYTQLLKQMLLDAGLFLLSALAGIVGLFASGGATFAALTAATGLAGWALTLLVFVGARFLLVITRAR